MTKFIFLLVLMSLVITPKSFAQLKQLPNNSYLVSQTDPEEAFDPFADYSEFEEATEEEADVNFFKHGRFFTVGFTGGMRGFTDNFAKAYSSAPTYGLYLSYFFDLRLAFVMGILTGDYGVQFNTSSPANTYTGNVSITMLNFDLKYFINPQNLTRGLADLNPYILGGFSKVDRTVTLSSASGFSPDSTTGVDLGLGIEIPMMRKKSYLGLQATYHYVSFSDENKDFFQGTEKLENKLNGDTYDLLIILGLNF